MALRDARRGLKPLLLSMSCVILGVASIVVAFSFRDNLQSSIRTQSKSLLGADLAIDSREPFSQEAEALIASLGGRSIAPDRLCFHGVLSRQRRFPPRPGQSH